MAMLDLEVDRELSSPLVPTGTGISAAACAWVRALDEDLIGALSYCCCVAACPVAGRACSSAATKGSTQKKREWALRTAHWLF